ncbi:hypothetical protein [uncultured Pseudodesulfovibrio sp.]|uniref:hypothetical protein n=1 Tax=uncultured Pseudodesulfovibrio sp. TaxID=2035858 RepID=UPI0029C8C04C|nr:hypothetical protein [uncultured Pseudodesulfovibrio sp.]
MSSTPLDLPVLISQLPYVAKIAHVEKAKPEIHQQLFGPMMAEHVQKNQSKVQQVNKKERTDPVDRDGRKNEQQAQSERRKKEEEPDDSPETGASSASPWSGNIVNVKI